MLNRTLFLSLTLATLAGCGGESLTTPAAQAKEPTAIVVVGDESAAEAVAAFRQANLAVSHDKARLRSASLIVIAQDARTGIMPVHRQLMQELAAAGKPEVLWVLTRVTQVDDSELLELEKQEVRELFETHKLPGDTIQFAVDFEAPTLAELKTTLKGWKAVTQFVLKRGQP